jgi:stalled ribosome alternative rescue factor ArfA
MTKKPKPKSRSTVAASLADPKFRPKAVPAAKGKRAYQRKPKHV